MEIVLRPAVASDHEFLYALYCVTMRDAIEATWGCWDEAWQRRNFVRRVTEYNVEAIEGTGSAYGGLMTEWLPDSLCVQELQLLPEYQGRGIGSRVLRAIIERAAQVGQPVTLSVLEANPRARKLYDHIGFTTTACEPPFTRMRHDLLVRGAV